MEPRFNPEQHAPESMLLTIMHISLPNKRNAHQNHIEIFTNFHLSDCQRLKFDNIFSWQSSGKHKHSSILLVEYKQLQYLLRAIQQWLFKKLHMHTPFDLAILCLGNYPTCITVYMQNDTVLRLFTQHCL